MPTSFLFGGHAEETTNNRTESTSRAQVYQSAEYCGGANKHQHVLTPRPIALASVR